MDESNRRKMIYVLFFSIFSSMIGLGIISPLLPIFAKKLGASGLWIGIIFSSFIVSRAVFMPIVGRLSDRIGKRGFLTRGLLLYAAVSLFYPLAKNVYTLAAIRLIHGISAAMILPVVMAFAAEIAGKRKPASTMSVLSMIIYVGVGMGPLAGGILNQKFGINSAFYAMAVLNIFAFFMVVFLLPDDRKTHKGDVVTPASLKKLLSYNIVRGVLLIIFDTAMRATVLLAFLPIFASKLNIDSSGVGIIIASTLILAGILEPPFGWMLDKLEKHHRRRHALKTVFIGSLIGSLGLFFVPFSTSFKTLLLSCSFVGIGVAIVVPAALDMSVAIGKKAGMGNWMGVFNTSRSLSMIITPVIAGAIIDFWGINPVFYIFSAVSFFGALACCYYLYRRLKGHKFAVRGAIPLE